MIIAETNRVITMNKIRTYSELLTFTTYEDRLNYLMERSTIGIETFGYDRYLNQRFYTSKEWLSVRDYVIVRDMACDLAIQDRPIIGDPDSRKDISSFIYVHHMNPLRKEDIINGSDFLLNPEYLICTSYETHSIIHYGSLEKYRGSLVEKPKIIERHKNDMCPWRK